MSRCSRAERFSIRPLPTPARSKRDRTLTSRRLAKNSSRPEIDPHRSRRAGPGSDAKVLKGNVFLRNGSATSSTHSDFRSVCRRCERQAPCHGAWRDRPVVDSVTSDERIGDVTRSPAKTSAMKAAKERRKRQRREAPTGSASEFRRGRVGAFAAPRPALRLTAFGRGAISERLSGVGANCPLPSFPFGGRREEDISAPSQEPQANPWVS